MTDRADAGQPAGRRADIVQLLRQAGRPLSAAAIAAEIGVHPNTARFHLEALVEAGLAGRQCQASAKPGRRRILYSGTGADRPPEPGQGYQLLAGLLARAIAQRYPDVGPDMYDIGQEWGRNLTTQPLLRDCPFPEETGTDPDVVCALHAGMVNTPLADLRSGCRWFRPAT